jgi:hypothetical protein
MKFFGFMVELREKQVSFLSAVFSVFQRQIYDICHLIRCTIKFTALHYCSAISRSEIDKTCFRSVRHLYYPVTNVASIRAAHDLSHCHKRSKLLLFFFVLLVGWYCGHFWPILQTPDGR